MYAENRRARDTQVAPLFWRLSKCVWHVGTLRLRTASFSQMVACFWAMPDKCRLVYRPPQVQVKNAVIHSHTACTTQSWSTTAGKTQALQANIMHPHSQHLSLQMSQQPTTFHTDFGIKLCAAHFELNVQKLTFTAEADSHLHNSHLGAVPFRQTTLLSRNDTFSNTTHT